MVLHSVFKEYVGGVDMRTRAWFVFLSFAFLLCANAWAGVPDAVKRVEFGTQVETHSRPLWYVQTVQPLSANSATTVFIQPRFSWRYPAWEAEVCQKETESALGLGVRTLNGDKLVGFNGFLDYRDQNEQYRMGVGFEMLGRIVDFRANAYHAVNGKRRYVTGVVEDYYERAISRFDMEVGVPLPFTPWLRVYAGGYVSDRTESKDYGGLKFRLEAKLKNALTIEGYTYTDKMIKGSPEYGARARCSLAFDSLNDLKEWVLTIEPEAYPGVDVSTRTLIPVERNNEMSL
jgi:hypothetical protein